MFTNMLKTKKKNNFFLWGLLAGVGLSFYMYRWMSGNKHHQHEGKQHAESSDQSGQSKQSQHHQVNATENQSKDQLFQEFLNASEEDVQQKASEMNFNN